MRHRTVQLVWAGGLLLAAVCYLTGPDRFVDAVFRLLALAQDDAVALLMTLGTRAADLVRALALGCFAVFLVLGMVATSRGHGVRAVLLVVSALFIILVLHHGPEDTGHWVLALALAATAALNLTRRLTQG